MKQIVETSERFFLFVFLPLANILVVIIVMPHLQKKVHNYGSFVSASTDRGPACQRSHTPQHTGGREKPSIGHFRDTASGRVQASLSGEIADVTILICKAHFSG